jgi:hypothetical protein
MKIMLRKNVKISIGLCIGSIGRITAINWQNPNADLDQQIPNIEVELILDFGNEIGRHEFT